jgi:hypothetical protein
MAVEGFAGIQKMSAGHSVRLRLSPAQPRCSVIPWLPDARRHCDPAGNQGSDPRWMTYRRTIVPNANILIQLPLSAESIAKLDYDAGLAGGYPGGFGKFDPVIAVAGRRPR